MGSETPAPFVEKTNAAVETSVGRSCAPKTKGKVPKRVHKAEREKLKRERLNELFLDLANALDPNQQNNEKASILCEATRLLKDLFGQIESLEKENASLVSESHYQSELSSYFHGDHPGLPAVEPALQQPSALLVVPICPDIQAYPVPDSTQPAAKPNSIVSKPHARYPTQADSWPSQLLGKQSAIRNEFQLNDRSPANL